MAGTLIVTEVDSSKLINVKTKEEKEAHIERLEFWEQEKLQETKDDHSKFSRVTREDLSAAPEILESICHISL